MACERVEQLNAVEVPPMSLLPPAPGRCPLCAVDHAAGDPHDAQSLFYQMRFYQAHGRWPRWSDAVAHCSEELRRLWADELEKSGDWSRVDYDALVLGAAIAETGQ